MIEITKEKLEEMYLSNTNEYTAKKLGMTVPTLLKYLEEAGITLKGKGNKAGGYSSKRLTIRES